MHNLIELFPFIKQTMIELEQQNKFMNKVTLTGKINALNVAANLFEFTDKTALIFDELKTELISALLDENIKKVTNELHFKAQTVIDILIRNLFERTADVGFLATDAKISSFLTSKEITTQDMHKHLQEYAAKYSVYNEIVIFDTAGHVQINLNQKNSFSVSKDPIIKEALESQSYVECYKHTDMFSSQNKTLLYAQKIVHNQKNIGVLCLCFKFEDELSTIFEHLSQNNILLTLNDSKEVLASNEKTPYIPYNNTKYQIIKNHSIAVTQKTSGYQGYRGIKDWYATAILNTKNVQSSPATQEELVEKNYSTLLSQELHTIIKKANNVLEDIADVIINGELIASKKKVYLLTPILDNLRTISSELLSSIKKSIKNLEFAVKEGFIHDVKMAAHLAIDIMDRNLYERANDSRWWALTEVFQQELSESEPNIALLHKELDYINTLYTVYTNIILFDKNKNIVATSKHPEIIGQKIEGEFIEKALHNTNTQHYFVSEFAKTPLYNDNATYIYAASILNEGKTVGGIAVVFDGAVEFKAMLQESFPKSHEGFICFVDKDKRVIASSDESIEILSVLEIDEQFIKATDEKSHCDFITFKGKKYIVASVASSGYREYKKEDNYKNEIYCLAFLSL